MAKLCLEMASDSGSSQEDSTYSDRAMEHIRVAISVLGLPLLGEEDPCQIAETDFCCCGAREKSILDHTEGVRRRRASWNARVRCSMGFANTANPPNRLLSNEEIQEVKEVFELLLRVNQKSAALQQWVLLIDCFTETSIGGAETYLRLQRDFEAALTKPAASAVNASDPGPPNK